MLAHLIDQVQTAHAERWRLSIRGAGTKAFYGEPEPAGLTLLHTTGLRGITAYQPSELVVTALAGTPLQELEATLAEQGQCLAFEPPHFGPPEAQGGTVGGMVAAGLSGPARAAQGSVRDHVLGATLINGRGELLRFGGQVIKNVAGYDVSRLLVGSLGILGVMAEVSLRVVPIAPARATLRLPCDAQQALNQLHQWGGQSLPLNASAWCDGLLTLRLCGAQAAVHSASTRLCAQGAQRVGEPEVHEFWAALRHQRAAFFVQAEAALAQGMSLWRLSLPQTAPPLALAGATLIEWHGGQRWLCTEQAAEPLRQAVAAAGGHATHFKGNQRAAGVFAPLAPPLAQIHHALKTSFDPEGVFNPGRLYPGL
jgi:glycolate oxidase FAD binding subunit